MNSVRFIFSKKLLECVVCVLIYQSEGSLTNSVDWIVKFSAMKHPDQWTVSKLRHYEAVHDKFPMFESHKVTDPRQSMQLLGSLGADV